MTPLGPQSALEATITLTHTYTLLFLQYIYITQSLWAYAFPITKIYFWKAASLSSYYAFPPAVM